MSTSPQPNQSQSPKWAVQAPDGKVIQFPDEFSDADVTREMTKMYPSDPYTKQTQSAARAAGVTNSGVSKTPLPSFGNWPGTKNSLPSPLDASQNTKMGMAPNEEPLGAPLMPIGGLSIPKVIGGLGGGYVGAKAGDYSGLPFGKEIGGFLGSLFGAGTGAHLEGIGRPGPLEVPEKINLPFGFKLPWNRTLPSEGTGAPLPSAGEFYEQRGAQLAKRPDELTQAVREGRAAKLPVRVPKPAAPEPQSPFAGLQSSSPADTSGLPSPKLPFLPQQAESPTTTSGPEAQISVKGTAPKTSRIVEPGSEPPDVKVTYQSVPQADLLQKVMSGDRLAITEWQRRGLQLPPNVGYMVEPGAGTLPWRNYKR